MSSMWRRWNIFCFTVQNLLLWKLAPVQWDGLMAYTDSLKDWWKKQGEIGRNGAMDERHELTAYIMWQTWKARNCWLYNSECWTELDIIQKAWDEWTEFKAQQTKNDGRCKWPE